MWEACINLTHAQHLVLLHEILVVANLKIILQTQNDLKSCSKQFQVCLYKKKTINDPKKNSFHPLLGAISSCVGAVEVLAATLGEEEVSEHVRDPLHTQEPAAGIDI